MKSRSVFTGGRQSQARQRGRRMTFRPSLSFVMLAGFLVVLWLAGGASRGDVPGQVVVRSAAWMALVATALFATKPMFKREWPALAFLVSSMVLAALQTIPLPPAIWQALPGRALLSEAALIAGEPQPWRPLSIVPSATFNAVGSLVVPFTVVVLLAGLRDSERQWLLTMLFGLILLSMLLALAQFSGSKFNNPFINDTVGQISASFANRNHLALFLAFGCLLAPVWAFSGKSQSLWRAPVALGTVVLLILTILATGSRAGLLLGGVALIIAPLLVRHDLRRAMRQYPTWVLPSVVLSSIALIGLAVLAAISSNRAMSINRVLADEGGEDMRSRALPTVLEMIATYFPAGSGLGGFDPIFRIHEPMALLKLTYYNHAHNDLLEVVLDAGLPGALLIVLALAWWAVASVRAWRAGPSATLARLGSALLGLTIVASAFDYPARTPMIMAMIVIAAGWLSGPKTTFKQPALRATGEHL